MKNRFFRITCLVLLLILVGLPTGMAAAKSINAIAISGPGIDGQITLNDPGDMLELMQAGFIDQAGMMVKPSRELGTPYTITVMLDLDGKSVPFLRMDYYPLSEGEAGYLHYTGRLDGSSLRTVDEWGLMPLQADGLFRRLMADEGIALQSAVAVAPEAAANPAPVVADPAAGVLIPDGNNMFNWPVLVAAIALVLLAAAGLLLRRRSVHSLRSR
jgi:hypothetical protein